MELLRDIQATLHAPEGLMKQDTAVWMLPGGGGLFSCIWENNRAEGIIMVITCRRSQGASNDLYDN